MMVPALVNVGMHVDVLHHAARAPRLVGKATVQHVVVKHDHAARLGC